MELAYPAQELQTLAAWDSTQLFETVLDTTRSRTPFVLYDGPPFANGLPHYGHLLTGYVKDAVPRYKTMKGYHVDRVFGWDTHGLPAELEAMKQLGLKTTDEVQQVGLEAFNETCRDAVLTYAEQWEATVRRQARWTSFERGYKTMDPNFMESTLWAFKQLYDKGLVYEGFKVLPYCWRDQTPLSNHELTMDGDGYQDVQVTTVTVGLHLYGTGLLQDVKLLVWTTTPWTLPANLLVAVNEEATYEVLRLADGVKVLAAPHARANYEQLAQADLLGTVQGADLVGLTYEPPFSYYAGQTNAHRVAGADWVEMEGDGTGLVHVAPGFGEEDKALCDEVGVATVVPMDDGGCFTLPVLDYEGEQVLAVSDKVAQDLKNGAGSVSESVYFFDARTMTHAYPHCWRCRTPLVYRGVDSWFVATTQMKHRMLDQAAKVQWVPESAGRQFTQWLEQVRDWGVSRNRFWGSPVPVWRSDDDRYPRTDVYGSFEELERDFGSLPRNSRGQVDLHRPYVDTLTRPNPDDPTGHSTMRRVPEVLDVWFDSGAMPFAQQHFPFENEDRFLASFPADFVVEYSAQTRGWFYTMHVLSTALFDRPAFKTCLSHGVLLGDDGQKMAKSRQNYPAVQHVFDKYGADAMRWYLLASPVLRGGNLMVSEEHLMTTVRRVLNPLTNLHTWARTQAPNAEPHDRSLHVLDRHALTSLSKYVNSMNKALDSYDFSTACSVSEEFLQLLANWFVRASRKRSTEDLQDSAVPTLLYVLQRLDRCLAPLLPLTTDHLWQTFWSGSVHEQTYPKPKEGDEDAYRLVEQARDVVHRASSLRKTQGVAQRQPLALARVSSAQGDLGPVRDLLEDQLNVKQVHFVPVKDNRAVKLLPRVAGPRLGQAMKQVLSSLKQGEYAVEEDRVQVCGFTLLPEEYEWVEQDTPNAARWAQGVVELDFNLTPELVSEGLALDLVREVQQQRKQMGLNVEDRAVCEVYCDGEYERELAPWTATVSARTRCDLVFKRGEREVRVLA